MKNFFIAFLLQFLLCGCIIPIYKPWNGDRYSMYSKIPAAGVSMSAEEEREFRDLINGDETRIELGLKPLLAEEKLLFNSNAAIYDFYRGLTFEELKQAVKKYEPQNEDFFFVSFGIYESNHVGNIISGWTETEKGFESFDAKIAKRFFFDGDVLYLTSCCPGKVERFFKFKNIGEGAWLLSSETDIFYFGDYVIIVEYDPKTQTAATRRHSFGDRYSLMKYINRESRHDWD